jgi:hypothetical protein
LLLVFVFTIQQLVTRLVIIFPVVAFQSCQYDFQYCKRSLAIVILPFSLSVDIPLPTFSVLPYFSFAVGIVDFNTEASD